jgi:hypothetical protein
MSAKKAIKTRRTKPLMAVAVHCLVRPSLADLTTLEIRCSRAEGRNAIHTVESALKWMRDLLNAPTWTPALQATWDMYRRGIDSALSGGPNVKIAYAD